MNDKAATCGAQLFRFVGIRACTCTWTTRHMFAFCRVTRSRGRFRIVAWVCSLGHARRCETKVSSGGVLFCNAPHRFLPRQMTFRSHLSRSCGAISVAKRTKSGNVLWKRPNWRDECEWQEGKVAETQMLLFRGILWRVQTLHCEAC